MIEIFPIIAADADCTRLLGSKPTRFYPFASAPQDGKRPYAVWQLVGGQPVHQLACTAALDHYTAQIDVYALTVQEARTIAYALRAALERDSHNTITNWAREDYEHDTQLYRVSFDADIYQSQP